MFWINAAPRDQSRDERCFVFESFTIAQIIADKLDCQGFEVQILNQDWEVPEVPDDPHRLLMGAWIA
jgi:hypothetical protein